MMTANDAISSPRSIRTPSENSFCPLRHFIKVHLTPLESNLFSSTSPYSPILFSSPLLSTSRNITEPKAHFSNPHSKGKQPQPPRPKPTDQPPVQRQPLHQWPLNQVQ